jgi:hypothetical protein
MARAPLVEDGGPAAFSHYDANGNPIDTNGYAMPDEPKGPPSQSPPDWQIATGAGAAPAGTFLPDWRAGQPDQAGATDAQGNPYPAVAPPEDTTAPPAVAAPPAAAAAPPAAAAAPLPADNPFGPWTGHFTAPTPQPLPDVPVFTPPTYTPPPAFSYDTPQPTFTEAPAFSYADFQAPSYEAAQQDPGYQFRLQQGNDALQNAASARGTLNDSGTLKALLDYGQGAASQEYGNVYDRAVTTYNTGYKGAADTYNTNYKTQYVDPYNNAVDAWKLGHDTALSTYNTNYQTQYKDPYTLAYQAARDVYAPQLTAYTTNAANVQHLNDTSNTNAWNDFFAGYQDYENRRNTASNFALSS